MHARQKVIKRLFREGVRHAICDTSVSGQVVCMFKQEGFQIIALIHELPNLIREFQLESSVKEIGHCADRVVFPAEFVRDRFCLSQGSNPRVQSSGHRAFTNPILKGGWAGFFFKCAE